MVLINFAHPITEAQLRRIEALTGRKVARLVDLYTQIDQAQPVASQVAALVDTIDLTPAEWQTASLLINPPSLSIAAVAVLAEIRGRCGYFPAHLHLRPAEGSLPRTYEVAEVVDLQGIQQAARKKRA